MYFLVLTSYKLLKRVLIHFSDKLDIVPVKEILLVALVDDSQFTFNTVRISHIELILNTCTCLWTPRLWQTMFEPSCLNFRLLMLKFMGVGKIWNFTV